jgi:hypothetical protein
MRFIISRSLKFLPLFSYSAQSKKVPPKLTSDDDHGPVSRILTSYRQYRPAGVAAIFMCLLHTSDWIDDCTYTKQNGRLSKKIKILCGVDFLNRDQGAKLRGRILSECIPSSLNLSLLKTTVSERCIERQAALCYFAFYSKLDL